MFSSVGWGEILVLLLAALVVLGPERLPSAVQWTLKSVRQVRDYASGATNQLREEIGVDFEEIRKPLQQLNDLRGMTPRAVITKHLFDGDEKFVQDTINEFTEPIDMFKKAADTSEISSFVKPKDLAKEVIPRNEGVTDPSDFDDVI